MVFKLSPLPGITDCTCLRNMQNSKSKYKIPVADTLLETKYLHPMVKGKDITPFHVKWDEYIVLFPYEESNTRIPIQMRELSVKAPRLAQYYNKHKKLILAQTEYNKKIIGNSEADFYALARVGEYSFAKNYIVFRDNTKWAAAVISEVETTWGEKKRPLFQNHAVSLCEDENGRFISYDEAHYICGILNSNLVEIHSAVVGKYQDTEHVKFKTVAPIQIASAIYKGSYEQIARVNAAVANWVVENRYDFDGKSFCIYHGSPAQTSDPKELVTEVCLPVKKK